MEPTAPVVRLLGVTMVRERMPDTFSDVYAAQYAPLVRLAYVTTGNLQAAEDVVQEVFTGL